RQENRVLRQAVVFALSKGACHEDATIMDVALQRGHVHDAPGRLPDLGLRRGPHLAFGTLPRSSAAIHPALARLPAQPRAGDARRRSRPPERARRPAVILGSTSSSPTKTRVRLSRTLVSLCNCRETDRSPTMNAPDR